MERIAAKELCERFDCFQHAFAGAFVFGPRREVTMAISLWLGYVGERSYEIHLRFGGIDDIERLRIFVDEAVEGDGGVELAYLGPERGYDRQKPGAWRIEMVLERGDGRLAFDCRSGRRWR